MMQRQQSVVPMFETIRHVAYRCGCVRTYKKTAGQPAACPDHKASTLSTTEEIVRRESRYA